MPTLPTRLLALALLLLDIIIFAPVILGGPDPCAARPNDTAGRLLECVTLPGVRAHQAALQSIAGAHNGHRAAGTPGYDQSAAYAAAVLTAAGYDVTLQTFQFETFISLRPPLLAVISPPPAGPVPATILRYSGSGDATAPVSQPLPSTGCAPADFAAFPPGHIALIRRGACDLAVKAGNAHNAGASGVIIANDAPGPAFGTLGPGFTRDLPVVAVTQSLGDQLAATPGLVMRLRADTFRGLATTANVLAETPGGDPDRVIMAGAHLDSVDAGPGIQDNGSGAAALLEVAEQLAGVAPRNKVRFALWSAEEAALAGSTHYVNTLEPAARDAIALYLNFDMIGSPNHVYFIYDGDDSDGVGAGPGPAGSAAIEQTFQHYYAGRGLPAKGWDLNGRSDYGPFIAAGIPAGGIFTGAEGLKTPAEAAQWGGAPGQPYDPCYHRACDTYDNINLDALDVNADAVAFAVLHFAQSPTGAAPATD